MPAGPHDQAILVLGMHRSGTSALTGALVQLGCAAPANQIPQLAQNSKGFFESRPIARLNDRLLDSAGRSWQDWRPLPNAWFSDPARAVQVAEGRALLRTEFGRPQLLALKDPRCCLLVPYWVRVLREEGLSPIVIHTHRHPLEVVRSLTARNGFTPAQGMVLWLSYVLQAEVRSRGLRRIFTSYDLLMANPVVALDDIGQALGLRYPQPPEQSREVLTDFLSAGMRHHDEAGSDGLPSFVASTLAVLERWTDTGEDIADHAVLDRIRELSFLLLEQGDGRDALAGSVHRALYNIDPDAAPAAASCAAQPESDAEIVANEEDPGPDAALTGLAMANETLRRALAQHETALAEAHSAHNELKRRMRALARRKTEAEARLECEKASHAKQQAQDEAQRVEERAALQDRMKTCDAKLTESLARGRDITLALAESSRQNTRLAAENSELHVLVAKVENQRRAMAESTIWRATGPLRKVLERVRGRRREG